MNTLGSLHMIPGLAPIDTTTTATEGYSDAVDVGEASEIEFDLYVGVLTGDDVVVKVYADANTTGGGGTAIPFSYKLSSATGTDVVGAWTAGVAANGVTLAAATDDGKLLRIVVNPAACGALPYCYIGMDPGASITAFVHSVTAVVVPRYQQDVPPSMVD